MNIRLKTRLDISFSVGVVLILLTLIGLIASDANANGNLVVNFVAEYFLLLFPLCLLEIDSLGILIFLYFLQLGFYLFIIPIMLENLFLKIKRYEPFLCTFYTITLITIGLIVLVFRAIYVA